MLAQLWSSRWPVKTRYSTAFSAELRLVGKGLTQCSNVHVESTFACRTERHALACEDWVQHCCFFSGGTPSVQEYSVPMYVFESTCERRTRRTLVVQAVCAAMNFIT